MKNGMNLHRILFIKKHNNSLQEVIMPLDDYIIAVFCLIDDLYSELKQKIKVRKAGYSPTVSDCELITMLLVGELLGLADNKKIWLYFKSNFLHFFPSLNHERYKIFNKQATNLWCVIGELHKVLLNSIGVWQHYLADGIPFPICHLARAKRSTLFKQYVAKHYCAAKNERYYGFKLLLVTSESGIPINYTLDAANIDERELLSRIDLPEGSSIIADKGFISKELTAKLNRSSGIKLITPPRRNMYQQISARTSKMITTVRKRIETTISQLTECFNLNTTKARSIHGLIGRINRKILSYTTALFFNYQIVKDQFTKLELLIQG
jgi:hypothetical protein